MSAASEVLAELLQRRARWEDGGQQELAAMLRKRDRKPPRRFNDASFLHIRSMAADGGARPLPGGVFWLSPDITLEPATAPGPMPAEIQAGHTYRVRCTVRNRGDVGAPAAKVELFLTDPSLGFDTRFATNLTIGQVPSAWVGSGASVPVEFLWTVPPSEAGHKCLFARVFSFSPLDVPADPHLLDPRLDRHVAQRNLNIVAQGQKYTFKMVHGGNARLRLGFRPIGAEELMKLDHGALEQVVPARELRRIEWGRMLGIELADGPGSAELQRLDDGLMLHARGDGPSHDERLKLLRRARAAMGRDEEGRHTRVRRHDLTEVLRALADAQVASTFTATIPDLGLQPGEAAGVHLTAIDEGAEELGPVGGIALVVTG